MHDRKKLIESRFSDTRIETLYKYETDAILIANASDSSHIKKMNYALMHLILQCVVTSSNLKIEIVLMCS
jgi:hypothetical protein